MNDVTVDYEPPMYGKLLVSVKLNTGIIRWKTWQSSWRGDVAVLRKVADRIEEEAREAGWDDEPS
jgi:hypothetical protein